jgi:hypothetical protein
MPITARASKPVSCIINRNSALNDDKEVRAAGPALAGRGTTTRRLLEPAAATAPPGARPRRPLATRGHVLRRWGWPRVPCASAAGGGKPVSSCSPSRGKDRREEEDGGTEELRLGPSPVGSGRMK